MGKNTRGGPLEAGGELLKYPMDGMNAGGLLKMELGIGGVGHGLVVSVVTGEGGHRSNGY